MYLYWVILLGVRVGTTTITNILVYYNFGEKWWEFDPCMIFYPITQKNLMTVDILIFTEFTSTTVFQRLIGAYRIATELRKNGYTVQVVDYLTEWTPEELNQICR